MSIALRDEFLLDPKITFLNHGSFGACPRPVFEVYQQWQRELERQPVEFLGRRYDTLMNEARSALAAYVGGEPDNLIFVPNSTVGANIIARSIPFQAGDEILTTDHEYGAMEFMWQFIAKQTGATIIKHPVPLPLNSAQEMVDSFCAAITPRTKLVFLSHITSPTAIKFPIEPIIQRASEAGILTFVDGAHAPGQIPLDMQALGVDFYVGNCHKWLCAPKGSAFLYARSEHHASLHPLVISWGWGFETSFVGHNQWQGTRDISAYLSVPAAIEFQERYQWHIVRQQCHDLARQAQEGLADLAKLPPLTTPDFYAQMFAAPLPPCDIQAIKTRLYDEYRIEIPLVEWQNNPYIRLSLQAYNSRADVDTLLHALREIFDL